MSFSIAKVHSRNIRHAENSCIFRRRRSILTMLKQCVRTGALDLVHAPHHVYCRIEPTDVVAIGRTRQQLIMSLETVPVLCFISHEVSSEPQNTTIIMGILNGWHRGERLVRQQIGFDSIPATHMLYSQISGEMPEQHSTFYSSRLQFLPICILDQDQRPWGSVLSGKDGNVGYIRHPRYNTLTIEASLWDGDPFYKYLDAVTSKKETPLIAGIGVELSTRRRNKFAGRITKLEWEKNIVNVELTVNQALGNCPKYIALRELSSHPRTTPVVLEDKRRLSVEERLSPDATSLILESDAVFFGTTYVAAPEEASAFPSHLGMNHRGGHPGFIRVKPSDGRTVVLPDFSGNRFMTSLGNVEATPLASLTFISFVTGDILYLTGEAKNVFGDAARAIMPFQDRLTEVYVTGYTYVRDAFPARETPGWQIQQSPYSPPVRLLAEEATESKLFATAEQPKAQLTRVKILSASLAIFDWESSVPLRILPGQAVIMDFSTLLGSRQYQHMSPRKPSLVNDDFIRTWTVSSYAPPDSNSHSFSLTMREKPGGIVTGSLFNILRKLAENRPELLENARELSLDVNVVGINESFVLPLIDRVVGAIDRGGTKLLYWFAGGIGITPFLSMLAALSGSSGTPPWNTTLVVSTREPDITLSLISRAIGETTCPPYLSIHIFTSKAMPSVNDSPLAFTPHSGRIGSSFFETREVELRSTDTDTFICGPELFERSILDLLGAAGGDTQRVHREGFAY